LTIQEFAEQNRVRVRRDSCGDEVIPGKPRNATRQEDRRHIFQHDGNLFGVCLLLSSARAFGNAMRRLLPLGFIPGQTGDAEGVLLFDPTNSEQAKAAIREMLLQRENVVSTATRLCHPLSIK